LNASNEIQELQFSSKSNEIFEFLKIKISQFQDERNKECSLVMDKMRIAEEKYMIHQHILI